MNRLPSQMSLSQHHGPLVTWSRHVNPREANPLVPHHAAEQARSTSSSLPRTRRPVHTVSGQIPHLGD